MKIKQNRRGIYLQSLRFTGNREPFLPGCVLVSRTKDLQQRPVVVDDTEIIKSIQAGNSESFSLIVDRYHRHLLNFVYRLLGDSQMVEDIGQEVFLSIYKSIRNFDVSRGIPFSAWLFITARNRCISELRKKKPRAVSIEVISGFSSNEKNPEQSASDEERLLAIHGALEQLPEPYKQTIMQSLRGDSPGDIARNNRIAGGTVKSRLSRARQRMKLMLHERFGGNPNG